MYSIGGHVILYIYQRQGINDNPQKGSKKEFQKGVDINNPLRYTRYIVRVKETKSLKGFKKRI